VHNFLSNLPIANFNAGNLSYFDGSNGIGWQKSIAGAPVFKAAVNF